MNISLRKGQLAVDKRSKSLCRVLKNDGYVDALILKYEHVKGVYPFLTRREFEFSPIMQDGALFVEDSK